MSNANTHLAHPHKTANTHPAPDHSGKAITILKVQPFEGASVVLTSDGVDLEGRLDAAHAQTGDDTSPPLAWTAVPDAQSWALVVEDPDAPRDEPVLHWAIWDIPGELSGLPSGVPHGAHSEAVATAIQGRNSRGEYGYRGPRPPKGDGAHRYYFQLFAVAKRLGLPADTSLAELTDALKGTAVASTQLVATFKIPDDGVQD